MTTSDIDARFPPIYTDRLYIRFFDPSRPEDYETVLEFYNSEYTKRFIGDVGMNTKEHIESRCEEGTMIPKVPGKPASATPKYPWHIVYLRSDLSRPVGINSLFTAVPFNKPTLGWAVREEIAGQGYASEAASAVLKCWVEDIGVTDLWAGTFPHHKASQRVAVKVGFEFGGTFSMKFPDGEVKEAIYYVLPGADKSNMEGRVMDLTQQPGMPSVPLVPAVELAA
ncbi:hypothetical protein LTR84_008466 [Exophiala bonariae]|uniref:N-acetyltransferase domain-containing protein n=1 Tax=Exophiala bonariae TaxID=1690606 RepID=A0AAV9N0G4_9EURO|nr:hypothetical protein LTR84_008466 [Exophiala bonariae]